MTNYRGDDDLIQRIHAAYLEYNKTLRAWLVGYGVGVPLLLITQQHLLDKISGSGWRSHIGYTFLLGVALQVLMAFLNKWSNWYRYAEEVRIDPPPPSYLIAVAQFIRQHPGIDVFSDIASIVLFSFATALTFRAILS